jgi:restriction endonuclease S subunit
LRGKRGAIQEGLNLTDLKEIKVFVPSHKFQSLTEEIIRKAFAFVKQSQEKYQESQSLLLSELGLADWKPKHRLSFVKNFSDTEGAGRIDAEYYQPKYEDIVNAIKTYSGGWDTLENLVKVKDKNITPEEKMQYKYIELANIGNEGEITDCMTEEGRNLPSRARRKVSTGDLIVSSIEGSLSSIALTGDEYDQALCSTGFHAINSRIINSETLLVLLKSIVGQLQLKKGCSGTILTAINQDEFARIVLPKIDEEIQIKIQQGVTESFALRKRSKHLLECAKRAVEIAIEKDERSATERLEKERWD